MAQVKEITVPDIGDFDEVDVIEVLVKPGDSVQPEDSLITLESDKATMEVPCPEAGTVQEVLVGTGDKVSEGTPIIKLEPAAEGNGGSGAEPPQEAEQPAPENEPEPATDETPSSGGTAAVEEVTVPDIGDFDEVDVIEVLVKAGDEVQAEDSLITLESDKATMEVPAPKAGIVESVKISVGDKVSEGTPILTLKVAGGASASAAEPSEPSQPSRPAPAEQQAEEAPPAPQEPPEIADAHPPQRHHEGRASEGGGAAPAIDHEGHRLAHASPSVRRFARELGVDLSRVKGSGPKDRILKEDVQAFVKGVIQGAPTGAAAATGTAPAAGGAIPAVEVPDFSKFGEVERQELTRIQKISGPHLHKSWLNVPHVTQFDEADITEMEAFRQSMKKEAEERGVRLTPLAFLIRAVVAALKEHPRFNSSLAPEGDALIMKKYYNIGVAVDTPGGLVVPVVKGADQLGIYELAEELARLSKKARDGKLSPGEMQGSNFSISSLGGISGTAFTPIVNAPEVAILGVSKSATKPVWNGKEFEPRLMLPLSLSYDHRVIDGAMAARFTGFLNRALGDIRRLLL
ncbi:dihydrolipoyllysine-residue acetyltransferase [Ectothiorhodospiraceae bacterium WFHF3C12]|nr:dihydrolipoyllysine-residue acetyltransferase [Ectothiorhodospiraceae bacterium WFHF3C12]